nr:Chain I, ANTAGONIST PEPTIDE AF10847 [synthetic construct]
ETPFTWEESNAYYWQPYALPL